MGVYTQTGGQRFVIAPGGLAEVWPPTDHTGLADELRAAGVVVAQCLLDPHEIAAAGPLRRAGFRHVTRLVTLTRPPGPVAPGRATMTVEPAGGPELVEVFAAVQAGSLDLPELTDLRPPAVELSGYPSGGRFIARQAGEAVGVLLLAPAEVLYLGLVPAARGRGLGHALLTHALRELAGGPAVTVGVDGRNLPALRLYERHGFRPCRSQEVFLWTPAH